jgi:HD-like signal output (HDOD) protein
LDEVKTCNSCNRTFKTEGDFFKNTSRWRVCSEENLWFNCACGSTLFLKKGKYEWYSAEKILSNDAKKIFDLLRQKQSLPHIKSAVFKLEEILRDPEVDLEEIAKTLRLEPLLLGEVIKIADRLKKVRGQDDAPITSVVHALAYVGKKPFSDLVLVASLKMIKVTTVDFKIHDFWDASFLTAILSEKICKKFANYHSPDEAYLSGFLCNIGKMVAAFHFPTEIDAIARRLKDPVQATDWLTAEGAASAHDHRVLGEVACAFWGLPVFVLDCVMKHHDVVDKKSDRVELYEVATLANQLTHWLRLDPQRIDQKLLKSAAARFKLNDLALENFVAEVSQAGALKGL